jgi:hypothetical protein
MRVRMFAWIVQARLASLTEDELRKHHAIKATLTAVITATQELMAKVCKREDGNKFAECTELKIAFQLIRWYDCDRLPSIICVPS